LGYKGYEDQSSERKRGERRPPMTTDYGEGVVRRFWEEIFGSGDIDAMDEIFADDFELHDLVYRKKHDLTDTKRIVGGTCQSVPGINVAVDDQRLTPDGRVFTRLTVRVSPPQDTGPSQRSASSVGRWEYSGMTTSRVVEGKIEKSWIIWEAIRAAEELEADFGVQRWWWPPWR
jgi:hypothetical protein